MHALVRRCEVNEHVLALVVDVRLENLLIYLADDIVVEVVEAVWRHHHVQ
jgi:hypothetical protein